MVVMTARSPEAPAHHPDVETAVFTDTSYTAVVWDGRGRVVHTLDPVSSAIWTLIDGTSSIAALAEQLVQLGLNEAQTAERMVAAAVAEFWSLGLLTGSRARPAAAPGCAIG